MVNKKPVQHAQNGLAVEFASVLAALVMGLYPGARKQNQIGAALILTQKTLNAKPRPVCLAYRILPTRHQKNAGNYFALISKAVILVKQQSFPATHLYRIGSIYGQHMERSGNQ
jgi:hypothetical protein